MGSDPPRSNSGPAQHGGQGKLRGSTLTAQGTFVHLSRDVCAFRVLFAARGGALSLRLVPPDA
ncbi:MAG: hypothetical protein ACPIOQ_60100, partial [Promethearchaeia archaeon]